MVSVGQVLKEIVFFRYGTGDLAEIGIFLREFFRRYRDLAVFNDGDAVAYGSDLIDIAAGDDNGRTLILKLRQIIEKAVLHIGVETAQRFIEEQETGRNGDGRSQRHFFLITAIHVFETLFDIDFKSINDFFDAFVFFAAMSFQCEVYVFPGFHFIIKINFAGDVSRIPFDIFGFVCYIHIKDFGLTVGRLDVVHQDPENSGLPCAVGADQTEDLTFVNGKVNAADTDSSAVFFGKLV